MSGCNDDVLFVRAGDAWAQTFRHHEDGLPLAFPGDSARVDVRIAATNEQLLTATIGDGLAFESTDGVQNLIHMTFDGDDTLALAIGGKRTELVLALQVYEAASEITTRKTIAVCSVIALPRIVD